MKNSRKKYLVRKLEKLKIEEAQLKRQIKDTHVEIERLQTEFKSFTKSYLYRLWQLAYILKHLKLPQNEN